MEPVKFGTGGWRAVIGDGFTKDNIQLLAAAVAAKMRDDGLADKGFVIGYDRRFLSKEAAQWVCEVIAGAGIRCRFIRRQSPTPLIMYAVRLYGMPFGMAVTASHNPAIYNGIKVFMAGGRDADEELTGELEGYLSAPGAGAVRAVPFEEALAGGMVEYVDPMNEYIDSILEMLDIQAIRARRLRVALDPMFGVSKTALQTVLLTARCDVELIHERHDTLFGGRLPSPSSRTLDALRSFVRDRHSDIGIATDGDADRLGVIDDAAQFVHPNRILALLYHYLLRYKGWKGAAVRNLATTHLLDRIAESFGERCYEVPVGFKHISAKMAQTGAIIGGESSGGLTVRGHIQGKDGIYAAALLVEMLAVSGHSLSALWQELEERYGRFEMVERDYRFPESRRAEIRTLLLEDRLLPDFGDSIEGVSYLDGCKVRFRDGWAVVRFSGTEPLLRIFAEAGSAQRADAWVGALEAFLGLLPAEN